MPEKKNPDYSASAVNLTNPSDARDYLVNLHSFRAELDNVLLEIEKAVPGGLKEKRAQIERDIENILKGVRGVIDNQGSFQDTVLGWYAVKQRRETITYRPDMARAVLEKKFADMVIVEAMDEKALGGLVKGGLVTPEQARECGEAKESFAYIIR